MAPIITQQSVDRRKARESQRHDYEVLKKLEDNIYLVRRRSNNEQLLAYPWDAGTQAADFLALMERGAKHAVANVLNHPNLVNHDNTLTGNVIAGTGTDVTFQHMLLWDFCDAGTLNNLLTEFPVQPKTVAGETPGSEVVVRFLPESLCWHVVLSVLRALAWLHEGYRDVDEVGTGCDGKTGRRDHKQWIMDKDWMPILHRDIRPDNIFFQHPRGSETYGFCKLGNLGNCYVSGHVNGMSAGHVVAPNAGDEKLTTIRANMAEGVDIFSIPKKDRPYTKGTELFQLGRVLYQMMSTQAAPVPEECHWQCNGYHADQTKEVRPGCQRYRHWCRMGKSSELVGYTEALRETLRDLLTTYRGTRDGPDETTVAVLRRARDGYVAWRRDTADGKMHRDLFEDEWQRQLNLDDKLAKDEELLQRQGQVSRQIWKTDKLEPQPRVAAPVVPAPTQG